MLQALLPFIPTIVKAVMKIKEAPHRAAPEVADVIGVSINPKDNKKALMAASITLLAYYGVTVGPEWVAFLDALVPVVGAIWTALFMVSESPES